ncbi:hypothetical protein [Actinoplanes regularis]|uniref:hypothetical protein n=1 Tax=Actinoplanes regularis TaxID=52697 RepID=UPI0025564CAF|nr:hypothetical protein [Actinoplanes regularis]
MPPTPTSTRIAMLGAGVLTVAALVAGAASPASAASAATIDPAADSAGLALAPGTVTVLRAGDSPFLFSYGYNSHLKIAGGYFTDGGKVYVVVKLNSGTKKFSKNVTAHTHPITPGGAIYVETTVASPCGAGNNGYARAYDYTTGRWSPRLPVPICQRID